MKNLNKILLTSTSSYEGYEYEQKFVVDKAMCLS